MKPDALLSTLQQRFERNKHRHPNISWEEIEAILQKDTILQVVKNMEATGGEPDVVVFDGLYYVDCSKESPKGRRSICYDRAALESRKKYPPKNDAMTLATEMGIELLTEEDYQILQSFGDFVTKTSSWLLTPEAVRELGGAIFGDFRFGRVFIYHNGAESYYAARGFRGKVKL